VPSDRNDMVPINVNSLTGKAEATTTMQVQANLKASTDVYSGTPAYDPTGTPAASMSNGDVTPDFQRTINVYDSQGGSQPLQLSYLKTGANTWAYEISYQGASSNLTSSSNLLASGTVDFNSDGTLKSITPTGASGPNADGTVSVTIPWDSTTSGLQPQNITVGFGTLNGSDGLTQFDNDSTIASTVNGALFGSLTGVSIDTNGVVTAQFSNGLSQNVYKIPLATFSNPDGLSEASGNAYLTSFDSGSPTISEADLGAAGTIKSKNLEGSTVDLATEFTNLITTQRAYSAASRIVTTASTMLDDLLQMGR